MASEVAERVVRAGRHDLGQRIAVFGMLLADRFGGYAAGCSLIFRTSPPVVPSGVRQSILPTLIGDR